MSSMVKAGCPKCGKPVSVEEEQATEPVACSSCQTTFVPAKVIEESNTRFQIWMFVGMLVIGIALVAYMAVTNRLNPKADGPEAPATAPADAGNDAGPE
jgi:DNA-directed RNA polymerase subunit RPC12/RpoP